MFRPLGIAAVLAVLASPVLAAEPISPQPPTIENYADALAAVLAQRDQALGRAVDLSVGLAAARREVERLRKDLAARPTADPSKP